MKGIPVKPKNVMGIENFAQVSPTLFRGAQPTAEGFAYLRSLGVTIDVDVRSPYPQSEKEQVLCGLNKIRYVHLYWRARPFLSVPNRQDVADFLELVRENQQARIFVHCRQGSDRTGVCCAAYRIFVEGWSPKAAAAEMSNFGYHWYIFPRWRPWVAHLNPQRLMHKKG